MWTPSLMTSTAPLLRKSSLPVFEPAVSTASRAGCLTTGKPASLLSRAAASGISEDMLRSFPLRGTNYLIPEIAKSSWTEVQLYPRRRSPTLDGNHERSDLKSASREDRHV